MRHQYSVRIVDAHGNMLAEETGSRFERTVGYLYQKHKLGRGTFLATTDWIERRGEWPIGKHVVQMGRRRGRSRTPLLDKKIYVEVGYAGWVGTNSPEQSKRAREGG